MKKLKENQLGVIHIAVILILIVIVAVGFVGWKVLDNNNNYSNDYNASRGQKETQENSNISVEYFSGAEYSERIDGPCRTSKHAEGENVSFVFSEPFPSLAKFNDAKIIKSTKTTNGEAKLYLKPGKYGLYMIDKDNKKRLYGELNIDNASNNKVLDNQGPWFIEVGPMNNRYTFTDLLPC